MYKSFASLVKFIPKYFILFDAVVSGIVFFLFFQFLFFLFTCLFLAVLDLRCFTVYSRVAVYGSLIAVASRAQAPGCVGFSSYGTWAQQPWFLGTGAQPQ